MHFAGLPREFSDGATAAIVIVPVPYDRTCTWKKGAEYGPRAVLEASLNLELYDIETRSEVYREGIRTDVPVFDAASPQQMVEAVERRVADHLAAGRYVVTLGGEHTVAVGAAWAHARRIPNLSVLQLDAHADDRVEYQGSRFNHACVAARLREAAPVVQVGIRSMDAGESGRADAGATFFAHDLQRDAAQWIPEVVARLTPDVYVTIDVDVFDPGTMPSTGTPEPGGLGWYPVLQLLRTVAAERRLVGFDVVELSPQSCAHAPDFLVAKLIYKTLSYVFAPHRQPVAAGAAGKESRA